MMNTQQQRLPYSVVRYYYDRLRDEAINVGVIVQTPTGARIKTGPIEAIRRAYPFLDADLIARQLRALTTMLESGRVEVFDYARGDRVELATADPQLLTALNNQLPEALALTAPRFAEVNAETPAGVQAPDEALLDYLLRTFVEPPKPRDIESPGQPVVRRAHTVLRRKAVSSIIQAARKAGLRKEDLEVEAKVKGRTREWHLDVRIPRARRFLQHILVLPEIEETYHEAAALARIWQDVRSRQRTASLTAVFYATNGASKSRLKAGEELLAADDIEAVYSTQLPTHYGELLGRQRLPRGSTAPR